MKNNRGRLGLSIIAGSLSFVGTASAVDLVIDGSYESSTTNVVSAVVRAGGNPSAGVDGGWTSFTTYTYAAGYTQPGPTGCGEVYLRPYPDAPGSQTVSQTVSLLRAVTAAQVDGSTAQYTASAWFCTYHGQNDYSDLTVQFLDAAQAPIGNPVPLGGAAFVAALPGGASNRAWGQDTRTGVVPAGARYATITTTSHALVNLPDGYVDLVSLDVTSGFVPVNVTAAVPANGATGVNLGAPVSVMLTDGTAPLNTNSLFMLFDNVVVMPDIQQSTGITTVRYNPPGLLASASTHSYQVAYGSQGGATPNVTNEYTFTMTSWRNVTLGAPIYLESFDQVAEGALPAGWTVENHTDPDIPGLNLNDFHSDSYLDWVVISRSTLSNLFTVEPGGADFPAVTNVAPNQVIDGKLVTNLLEGNFIFAVSDRADNEKQVQYLFTRDYDLSGKTNVHLSFHSAWTQNQDSMAAVEYSINGGTTWLPAIYMLEGPDIAKDLSGGIDASNTLAAVHDDVPNLAAATLGNGNYGQFIGVTADQWGTLAPFLSARVNDDQVESKRMEILRLRQADNQATVRVRFSTVGTYSWFWAVDDVGFYSVDEPPSLLTGPTPATQTVAIGNSGSFSIANPGGTAPFTYQWRHDGADLAGATTPTFSFQVNQFSDAGAYDVVVSNARGSVTSPPPAAVLTVINPPVFVTGQWDFKSNLLATIGRDLEYFDTTVSNDTSFGTPTSFGIADINGQPTTVMQFFPSTLQWGGYIMHHGAAPNGGGDYVNQYTLVYDLYLPYGAAWRSLLQTATANGNDGDLFLNNADSIGIGISSVYNGNVSVGAWHRIAVAFDLTGPGQAPVLTKFIDGVKVGNQTTGLSGRDGRFSLDPYALLFADDDGDVAQLYVSSVQFSDGRRPDAFLSALGGPSAKKIPGAITARMENGQAVIRWTGDVQLESAAAFSGPWTTVAGATSPYPVPSGTSLKFYRPKIF
ncbi:MAG TPA: hypothetical protein VJA21_24415 [Verrucomicrobiae bacterium]